MRRNFSTSRGTSHSLVTDRSASMSGFPRGNCSWPPPPVGQAGRKDGRFGPADVGRDDCVPFRSELFAGFLFLCIVSPFLLPLFVTKDRSASRLQRFLSQASSQGPISCWQDTYQGALGRQLSFKYASGACTVLSIARSFAASRASVLLCLCMVASIVYERIE
jgi:uncharacterized protein YgiB involved in biofilm formation